MPGWGSNLGGPVLQDFKSIATTIMPSVEQMRSYSINYGVESLEIEGVSGCSVHTSVDRGPEIVIAKLEIEYAGKRCTY